MGSIKIATGKSRKSLRWDNSIYDWGRFVRRCSEPVRTSETIAEYRAMSKDTQSDIKDVGGFVGGFLIDEAAGRRKGNIAFRSCLTLDIDRPTADLWGNFTKAYAGAAVCYSTHKHTPENPRLRLVIPFNRDVTPEEYPAISRKFCADMGLMEYIDHTTHETNRVFYWPSVSLDGVFYHMSQEGEPLDVDAVLSEYTDWHDRSQWPTSPDEAGQIRESAAHVADPLQKSGVIGAFCRTYTMPEALEKFLTDVYEPCEAVSDRYTYCRGTTSAGVILYDDKFIYSHHESDPAGGRLLNAFDAVRLHKFGALDATAKPGTPLNRLPSYSAMCDLCINDPETKNTIMKEKAQAAHNDFADIQADEEAIDWQDDLAVDRKGNVLNTLNNLRLIILNDEVLRRVRHDQFARKDVTEAHQLQSAGGGTSVNDEVLGKMALYIEARYGLRVTGKKVDEMLAATATERGFNPVKEFITSTQWDGKKRVDTLLIDYLGATDNAANREVTRKWLVAAVARAFNPGCTFQNVLTLTGAQGIGKSVFLQTLAANRDWYCGRFPLTMQEGKRKEAIRGKWIVELNELEGLYRSEWQGLKAYISDERDESRDAYAIRRTDIPRQQVFAATTNSTEFLREADKGNRRWWVVPVRGRGAVCDWIGRLIDEVPQIWAEAYQLYLNGEDIRRLSDSTAEYMKTMQLKHSEEADDPMPGLIDAYLDTQLPVDWETRSEASRRAYFRDRDPLEAIGTMRRNKICAVVYLYEAEGLRPKDGGYKSRAMKFNAYMRSMPARWEACDRVDFTIYGRQRGYTRKPDDIDDEAL